MRKTAKITIVFVAIIMCATLFAGCTSLSAEEEAVAGLYNLTQIDGLKNDDGEDITADMYDENYIKLDKDKTFTIYNVEAGYTYKANGKWSFSGETLTLKLSGLFSKKESHTLKNNTITMTGDVNGKSVTMTFTLAE